jgi:hypothetical protein
VRGFLKGARRVADYESSFGNALRAAVPSTNIRRPSLTNGPFLRSHCLMRTHRVSITTFVAFDKLGAIRGHWKTVPAHRIRRWVRLTGNQPPRLRQIM